MPSAPHTISSQSRKKLKAFQFVQNEEDNNISVTSEQGDGSNKENQSAANNGQHLSNETQTQEGSQTEDCQGSSLGQRKECPTTPAATRIPLSDLIGNTEDAFNQEPNAKTPDEHVYWQHGPRSSAVSNSSRSSRRGKKRARSSSPPSSSQAEKSAHFTAQRDTLDLHHLQQMLKTPHNDPALDLWNRYADTTLGKSGDRSALHSIAHLVGSSPQTPGAAGGKDSTGLQRSISCGIDWPSSKAKRRKIDPEESFNRARDIFAEHKSKILGTDQPKVSRVSLLVEKIQESMARHPRVEISGPSSSSPLPDRAGMMPTPCTPSRTKGATVTFADPPEAKSNAINQHEQSAESHEAGKDASSDYGGEDLDMDVGLLDAMDQETRPQKETHEHARPEKPSIQLWPAQTTSHSTKAKKSAISPAMSGNQTAEETLSPLLEQAVLSRKGGEPQEENIDDEFDDDDDIFLEADIEHIMAQNGITNDVKRKDQITENTAERSHTLERTVDTALDEDAIDEFDDGFADDDDIWTQLGNSTDMEISKGRLTQHVALSPVVSVKPERSNERKAILLRQSWFDTPVANGSYVHIIGTFDRLGQCIVDDADNMIILHPDHLLSATVVADSFQCIRRAVLQDRVKATSEADKAQVYGSVLHHILQAAMTNNRWDLEWLMVTIEKILQTSFLESLHEIHVAIPEAVDYLMSKMEDLRAWASVFIAPKPSPKGIVQDRNGKQAKMSINKLLEVEEHIWSPMYGLKGNVDATVQVVMQDEVDSHSRTLTVPFEFKTGKRDTSDTHRAQTALYTLLMSDRYDLDVVYGILYYLETAKTFRIQGIRNEIRHMIIQRNFLASYVHNKLDLPPMLQRPHMCNKCYAQTSCFIYHKLVDDGNGQTSGLKDKFENFVRHLKPSHSEFFRKWDDLLTKEERDAMKIRRELWTMLSVEREALGRCFSKVIIEDGSAYEENDGPKINRFQYSFVKQRPTARFSFTDSKLTVGEPIVISDEEGHFALANGYVTKVRPSKVTVAVDRRLHNVRTKGRKFNSQTNQVFRGITELAPNGTPFTPTSPETEDPILYRLDKDEFSNGMAGVRNNLIRMMEKDLFRARELRELIIDGQSPKFKPTSSAFTLSGPASQQDLNVDQKQAIEKVMSAQDYALVLGMPGTGKTTTIAHIIRALVSQGKSVLLTSYTHTAVDNILLKIKDDKIRILRLGAPTKVHPEVQNFADLAGLPKASIEQLEDSYVSSRVVATTCLGINHPLFNSRIFDYCIVDEASQITLPVCLGPIRMAKKFILVGDHYQLPPLVQNKEAQSGGLDISLFKTLSESHPEAVVSLSHQYRMAEDIMLLSNTLIYNHRLKCGTPAVASRTLHIPNLSAGLAAAHSHHPIPSTSSSLPLPPPPTTATPTPCPNTPSTCLLHHALSPTRVLFLNTDSLGPSALERLSSSSSRITNPTEASLTALLVSALLSSGVPASSIGIITFYRSQLALLRQHPLLSGAVAAGQLEMHTADKFQGRDKEVVVLSCVRSNEGMVLGELLRDWRRVNVAVTRARSKLVVVGSKNTLKGGGVECLRGLVGICEERGWVRDLEGGVLEGHGMGGGIERGVVDGSPVKERRRDRLIEEELKAHGARVRQPLWPSQPRASQTQSESKSRSRSPRKRSPMKQKKNTTTIAGISGSHGAMKKAPKKIVKGGNFHVERATEVGTVVRDILNEVGYEGFE
ncbi:MAG: hypothetical protein Q9160_000134 [Pyrenula sp. 1 TL-2023]